MYFGAINRMIFLELVKVFLITLTALTGMFLLAGLVQEASQKGLSPVQVLLAIPYIIPNTLPFTIPSTTLFSVCIVYGRMSADNEVIVLKSAGVNIYHLLWPALLLGVLTTGVTGYLYYDVIPMSQRKLQKQFLEDAEEVLYGLLKREGSLKQSSLDFVVYVKDVQGKDLIDVVVKKRNKNRDGYDLVARAQTARLIVQWDDNPDALPKLTVVMGRCVVDHGSGDSSEVTSERYSTTLPVSIFGKTAKERPSSLTWKELTVRENEILKELREVEAIVADLKSQGETQISATMNAREIAEEYKHKLKHVDNLLNKVRTERHMRPATAVGCLCFVLIGCPVGIWANRSDYLSIFIICFLPAVFAYYPLLLAGANMSKEGSIPPYGPWAANIFLLISSLVLIRRLMKR
ncbi:MAG: LptF/LptG family permease [Zavarzinella sp.]